MIRIVIVVERKAEDGLGKGSNQGKAIHFFLI